MKTEKEFLPLPFGVAGYYPPGSEIGRNPQFCEDKQEKTMKFVIYGRENCSFCKRAEFAKNSLQLPDNRWLAIGKTDLQKGFMAVIRSIAKPTTF